MPLEAAKHSDYRAAPRRAFKPDILCHVIHVASNGRWPAWVRDVSVTGISVLVEPRFEPGTPFILDLRTLDGSFSRQLTAEVKHSAICFPNNCWLHGCVFEKSLGEDEVARLAWLAQESRNMKE